MQVSCDGGTTFSTIGRLDGPCAGNCKSLGFTGVPAGVKQALVRLRGTQRNTIMVFDLRIDARYREPAGGFRPVKITYLWEEAGKERKDEHVATTAQETYRIQCESAPTMKSIVLELAGK